MSAEWSLEIGDVTTRSEVKDQYGGGLQRGIERSRSTPNIFIYSDPSQGEQHGYDYDGWETDESSAVYYYTGEGQLGDQVATARGNGAILRHAEHGYSLRLFEALGGKQRGGKPQKYIGEFYVDTVDPWVYGEALDREGNPRQVVVFKLRAVDPVHSRAASGATTVAAPVESVIEFDERTLREAALTWLERRTDGGRQALSLEDLGDFPGGYALIDRAAALWQPTGFEAAFSYRAEGEGDTAQVSEVGLRLLASARSHVEGLERAQARRLPLVWFQGVGAGRYLALFPLYVVGREGDTFLFAADETFGRVSEVPESALESAVRRYAMAETKRRLHQPLFRAHVLRAYGRRCAVCALAHIELLDAAHIVPDSDELGVPTIQNGLALCKLHHAAYDSQILGITPGLTVEVADHILDEVDGPTLKYGLQQRHGQRLMVLPSLTQEWPDVELLARQYDRFRTGRDVG